jgi:bifunctional DNA-binding transcriptional regulator/antitoxin component of YhaV-PrlF toxin-antitoxin module
MVKVMFQPNGQAIITVPKLVVDNMNIEKGDGIEFIRSTGLKDELTYFIFVDKGKYKEEEKNGNDIESNSGKQTVPTN